MSKSHIQKTRILKNSQSPTVKKNKTVPLENGQMT